jgi:hypothetical protein
MTVSRVGYVVVWAFLACSIVTAGGNHLFAAEKSSDENAELIATPTPSEDNNQIDATEVSSTIEEPCDNGCTYCGVPLCSPQGRLWVRGDWMMWWTKGVDMPALVTTSPQGTSQDQAGVLGQPGTTVLFGDSTVYNDGRSGVRITIGGWLDNCHRWGLEADWLTLAGKSIGYEQSSTGNPILARPFFNVQDVYFDTETEQFETQVPAEDAQLKAYPGVVTGSVTVSGGDYFESVGAALRYNLSCCPCEEPCVDECDAGCGGCGSCDPLRMYYTRTDLLLGYRNYLLGDNLNIHEDIFDVQRDARFQITDVFNARNEFHGTEIGLNTELRRGRWSLGLLAKMAVGNNHQTVRINGSTTITNAAGDVATYPAGIYAVGTNSGIYTRDQFLVIPQLNLEMGYQLTCRLRTFVGYNLIYWAPVMRASDQIDRNLDPRNFPPPDPTQGPATPFPQYLGKCTNFWAQGVNVGAEVRF